MLPHNIVCKSTERRGAGVAGGGHDGNVTGDGGCVQGLIRVKKDVMAMIRGGSGLRPSLVDIGTGGPLTTDAL